MCEKLHVLLRPPPVSPVSPPPRPTTDPSRKEMRSISPRALLSSHNEAHGQPSSSPEEGTAGGSSGTRSVRHEDGVMNQRGHQRSSFGSDEMNARGRGRRALSEEDACHHLGEHHSNGNNGHGGGHGGHGGHSHGLGEVGDGVWVRLALLLALSVHSVMEGLGVGAKSTKAYNLLFAIAVHKVWWARGGVVVFSQG